MIFCVQAWIYEHFQGAAFGSREVDDTYAEGAPRATRWKLTRGAGLVEPYRHALDRLTDADVTWEPYAGHRATRSWEPIALYRGFIRFGPTMLPYLPDRVLRQFGHAQPIPGDPRDIRRQSVSPEALDRMWFAFDQHLVQVGPRVAPHRLASAVEPGYMAWFRRISHPYIYPANVPAGDVSFNELSACFLC